MGRKSSLRWSDYPLCRRCCLCLLWNNIVGGKYKYTDSPSSPGESSSTIPSPQHGQILVRSYLDVILLGSWISKIPECCLVREFVVCPAWQMSFVSSIRESFSRVAEPQSPWLKTAFLSCPVTTGSHISGNLICGRSLSFDSQLWILACRVLGFSALSLAWGSLSACCNSFWVPADILSGLLRWDACFSPQPHHIALWIP